MCFHVSITRRADEIEELFNARFIEPERFRPVYHVSAFTAPHLPVITADSPDLIRFMGWGLIPFWVKDRATAKQMRVRCANARDDTIFHRPSFREPIRKRRCLVIADGFYEWREYEGKKYPYHIRLSDRRPFAFAGIWDVWRDPGRNAGTGWTGGAEQTGRTEQTGKPEQAGEIGSPRKIGLAEPIGQAEHTLQAGGGAVPGDCGTDPSGARARETFSIITTSANPLMALIHNRRQRMPVILRAEDHAAWLNASLDAEGIADLLQPYDERKMEAFTVSGIVSRRGAGTNVPEVMEPMFYPGLPELPMVTGIQGMTGIRRVQERDDTTGDAPPGTKQPVRRFVDTTLEQY